MDTNDAIEHLRKAVAPGRPINSEPGRAAMTFKEALEIAKIEARAFKRVTYVHRAGDSFVVSPLNAEQYRRSVYHDDEPPWDDFEETSWPEPALDRDFEPLDSPHDYWAGLEASSEEGWFHPD